MLFKGQNLKKFRASRLKNPNFDTLKVRAGDDRKCRERWGMGFSEGGGDPKKGGAGLKKRGSYPSANYVHLTPLFLSLHLTLLP